ncbi:MAG: EVE domain-containing protein [Gammaproteobacteria bacterium]|nr:EVE domain-containing protein [Gammaproteobacteria bacterium]
MAYWLMKSEPGEFSLDDLTKEPGKTAMWDGVRNYQARNMMRDEMKKGDLAFFYHSNCDVPGIVGIVSVAREGYPDPTAFDPQDKHFDPKSDPDNPRWHCIDVRYKRRMKRVLALAELKEHAALADMQLLRKGNRLSVMPVAPAHWDYILELE